MKRWTITTGLVAGMLISSIVACSTSKIAKPSPGTSSTPSTPASTYKCVAGPDEQCASDIWYDDYQHMKALQSPYVMPKNVQDEVSGIAMRLRAQIPNGFQWDDGKQRFVKTPVQTPAQSQPGMPQPVRPNK